ncbi:carboxylating nicotinate-nucleotide diphosphorylase [Infirmifilum lucidum]|uniref:Nicotinate-nucleotide pyrophosphorylase [carboxylating] n=1 Tax=Infirmifilum lucidum TaxID=2776706 RepID=A0A7L9FFX8_9CREN|nr:carboxylating nicotinate-nucleotide diphosphorylase [Infirmifilum lucidum]QOJ78700.1 carboxylating nicotinate-nucleotide diphosphorylase [Infirmifilum lucidum]
MRSRVLAEKILKWVEEDAPLGDLTSDFVVPRGSVARAVILLKSSEAVVACTEDIAEALAHLGIQVEGLEPSGSLVGKGASVMALKGDARDILVLERTLLNLLNYCMGVATTARMFVEAARRVDPRVRVAVTRKTPPGLREIAKQAARAGGADTHRLSLSDAILIKDNHITLAGGLEEAVRRALARKSFIHKVEVEVQSAEDALKAARLGVDVVMLDNVSPEEVERAVELLEAEGLRSRVLVEASGGITLDNIAAYVKAGPDVVSSSAITMRPLPVDISLEVV